MSVISREIIQRSTCANVTALGGTNILLDPKQRVECQRLCKLAISVITEMIIPGTIFWLRMKDCSTNI